MIRRIRRPGRIAVDRKRSGLPVGESPRQQVERLRAAQFARALRSSSR